MSDTDLAERVADLEERVHYLERELELSVEEERFERQVSRILPAREFTIEENGMGGYTAKVEIPPGELRQAIHQIDQIEDTDWRVAESDTDKIVLSIEQGLHYR